MQLYINNHSGVPIYDQICHQIKSQIICGELQEGEALPSIRGLARDLRISVITTKRAYDELEQEGFLFTVPAKGCFVAARNVELLQKENQEKIKQYMQEILNLSHTCRLTPADITKMWQELAGEEIE